MASAFTIEIEVKSRLGLARAIMRLAPVLGAERASRWAWRVALWRSRWRMPGGRWERLR